MSVFHKSLNEYRKGDNWKQNFKHLNYPNVEPAVRKILTAKEPEKTYDRLGNHNGSTGRLKPLSTDEKIFRLLVLLDSQIEDTIQRVAIVRRKRDEETK